MELRVYDQVRKSGSMFSLYVLNRHSYEKGQYVEKMGITGCTSCCYIVNRKALLRCAERSETGSPVTSSPFYGSCIGTALPSLYQYGLVSRSLANGYINAEGNNI